MLKIQEFISCFDNMEEANVHLRHNLKIESVATTVFEKNSSYRTTLYKPMLNANMSDPLVREAHCLLLDENADVMAKAWDHPVIASNAKDFDRNFAFSVEDTSEEIPDGGIVVVYNIEGKWHIGSPNDAYGEEFLPGLSLPSLTYANQVKSYLDYRHDGWDAPFLNLNPMLCFVFCFVARYATNVMPIERSKLYLMTAINLDDHRGVSARELSTEAVNHLAKNMKVLRPITTDIYGTVSLASSLRRMRTLAPGLMVKGKRNSRVVIPNPIYAAMKIALAAGDRVRPIHMAKLLNSLRDKPDFNVLIVSYPDIEPMMTLLWDTRIEMWQELLELWKLTAPIRDDMHDFAVMVQHHPLNYILFKAKDSSVDICTEVENLKPERLVKLVKEKHEKEFDNAAKLLKFLGGSRHVEEESGKEKGSKEETSIPFCQEGD